MRNSLSLSLHLLLFDFDLFGHLEALPSWAGSGAAGVEWVFATFYLVLITFKLCRAGGIGSLGLRRVILV